MPKVSRFLIHDNQRVDNRIYVLHTRTPRMLLEVYREDSNISEELLEELTSRHEYIVKFSIKDKIYIVGEVWVVKEDIRSTKEITNVINQVMKRLSDWLQNYLKNATELRRLQDKRFL